MWGSVATWCNHVAIVAQHGTSTSSVVQGFLLKHTRVLVHAYVEKDFMPSTMSAEMTTVIDPTLLVCTESGSNGSLSPSSVSSSVSSPALPSSSKRPAEALPSSYMPACKGRKSTEDEKLARRLARQQRNRKSAQVSREKKKAYMDQIEYELATLRADKQASVQREHAASLRCAQLESKVEELSKRLRQFESIVGDWVKSHPGATDVSSSMASMRDMELQSVDHGINGSGINVSELDVARANAAPAAAPTEAGPSSPIVRETTDSTCLPAAKATSRLYQTNDEALQRVLPDQSDSSAKVIRTKSLCRPMQQPTAAALLPDAHLKGAACSRRQTPRLTPCYRVSQSLPLTTAKMTTRCTYPQLHHGTLTPSPVLRLRLKIPQHKMDLVLRKYARPQVTA